MILELELEALTDLCLSSSNHTLGQPETHDHIPGRTLWGALANLAYRSGMSDEDAFRIFHQGSVRVLDAVPLWKGERTYPVPGSWHQPKEKPDADCENFALEAVRKKQGKTQYKARKGGWLTPGGMLVAPEKSYSLRTAVDPSGKARQGLLYGLPVLQSGALFWSAAIGPDKDLDLLMKFLNNAELRLGRSRNSELGLVKVKSRSGASDLKHGSGSAKTVSILCVSRCIFRDAATGAPTLRPAPDVWGLDESWTFDAASSFLRSTRIVHFNSKRGRPEGERFALERGSVLTYRSDKNSVMLANVIRTVESGVGEYCGQGYGEVLISPNWLTQESIKIQGVATSQPVAAPAPNDELFQWASHRAQQRRTTTDLYRDASNEAQRFRGYRVPGSQWGALRAMAREARFRDSKDLLDQIFHKENGFLTTGKRGLSAPWKRARDPLKELCDQQQGNLPVFLELLASACMRPGQEQDAQLISGGNER